MKKFICSLILFTGTSFFSANLYSQISSTSTLFPSQIYSEEKPGKALNSETVNQRAYSNFHRQFGNEIKERWDLTKSGCRASFIDDGNRCTVMYNCRGKWLHTITSNNERHASAASAALVEKFYPGYKIVLEIIVDSYLGKGQLLKIEDQHSCKTLRISDGQVEQISEFEKA